MSVRRFAKRRGVEPWDMPAADGTLFGLLAYHAGFGLELGPPGQSDQLLSFPFQATKSQAKEFATQLRSLPVSTLDWVRRCGKHVGFWTGSTEELSAHMLTLCGWLDRCGGFRAED